MKIHDLPNPFTLKILFYQLSTAAFPIVFLEPCPDFIIAMNLFISFVNERLYEANTRM